jgi:type II secretory pathway predicted ATPase ExeA
VLAGDIYQGFYGLAERPFTLLPDPDAVFWAEGHTAAYTVLEYGVVARAPITVLTGEIGVGKTTVLRRLMEQIDDTTTVALVSNAHGGRAEMLRWVTNALGLRPEPGADYVALYQMLQDFLIEEYAACRSVTVIIDEAQNLSVEALEELRMLTNINSGKDELVQLILVGQSELRNRIMRPELQQFAQRIVAAYHLSPLGADATADYVRYRLTRAGGRPDLFSDAALEEISRLTAGVPRLINKLCEFCLVYGAINEESPVTIETVRLVVDDGIFVTGFIESGKAAE